MRRRTRDGRACRLPGLRPCLPPLDPHRYQEERWRGRGGPAPVTSRLSRADAGRAPVNEPPLALAVLCLPVCAMPTPFRPPRAPGDLVPSHAGRCARGTGRWWDGWLAGRRAGMAWPIRHRTVPRAQVSGLGRTLQMQRRTHGARTKGIGIRRVRTGLGDGELCPCALLLLLGDDSADRSTELSSANARVEMHIVTNRSVRATRSNTHCDADVHTYAFSPSPTYCCVWCMTRGRRG